MASEACHVSVRYLPILPFPAVPQSCQDGEVSIRVGVKTWSATESEQNNIQYFCLMCAFLRRAAESDIDLKAELLI